MRPNPRVLGNLPRQPDSGWWAAMRRRNQPWPILDATIIFTAEEMFDLIRKNRVSKALPESIAHHRLASDLSRRFARCALTAVGGERHRMLRSALDAYWIDGNRARFDDHCRNRIENMIRRGDVSEFPRQVAAMVVANLVGASESSEMVDLLLDISPHLAGLVNNDSTASVSETERLLETVFTQLNCHSETAGSLLQHLRQCASLTLDEVTCLTLFVVSAAAETLQSLTQTCIFASTASPRPPVNDVLRWATPVPFMFYGAAEDLSVSGCLIRKGTLVLFCLGSMNEESRVRDATFGYGSHYCFGARLASACGQVLLDCLPDIQIVNLPQWDRTRFVRRLQFAGPFGLPDESRPASFKDG